MYFSGFLVSYLAGYCVVLCICECFFVFLPSGFLLFVEWHVVAMWDCVFWCGFVFFFYGFLWFSIVFLWVWGGHCGVLLLCDPANLQFKPS